MSRIKLNIIGLSSGQSNGSYTLILGEDGGRRKLPIIIGSFEAQAIAIEIEKIVPFRPMTHDLFLSFSQTFHVLVTEVIIYNLIDGVFHAKLVCEQDNNVYEIDARTSDSIALAVRFKCPIYTYEDIMEAAGVVFSEDMDEDDMVAERNEEELRAKRAPGDLASVSLDELHQKLEEALKVEDYAKAAKIRDEIQKRKK